MCFFTVYIGTLFDKWTGLLTAAALTLWYRSEYYVPPRKKVKDNATQTEAIGKTEGSTGQGAKKAGKDEEEEILLIDYFANP